MTAPYPDGCVPGHGPRTDCPTHPPTADDTVAVWLGHHCNGPTPYQLACRADAELQAIAERVASGFVTVEQLRPGRVAQLVAAGYLPNGES